MQVDIQEADIARQWYDAKQFMALDTVPVAPVDSIAQLSSSLYFNEVQVKQHLAFTNLGCHELNICHSQILNEAYTTLIAPKFTSVQGGTVQNLCLLGDPTGQNVEQLHLIECQLNDISLHSLQAEELIIDSCEAKDLVLIDSQIAQNLILKENFGETLILDKVQANGHSEFSGGQWEQVRLQDSHFDTFAFGPDELDLIEWYACQVNELTWTQSSYIQQWLMSGGRMTAPAQSEQSELSVYWKVILKNLEVSGPLFCLQAN